MNELNKVREELNGARIAKETTDVTPWLILLTIALLMGKLIGWWSSMPWMWVFSPLWLPFALLFGVFAIFGVVAIIAFIVVLVASVLDR